MTATVEFGTASTVAQAERPTDAIADTRNAIKRYMACIHEPGDVVEMRAIHDDGRTYSPKRLIVLVSELVSSDNIKSMLDWSSQGYNPCCTANSIVRGLLHGLPAYDPVTLVSVTAILVFTAMAATWTPARKALQVGPAELLREE